MSNAMTSLKVVRTLVFVCLLAVSPLPADATTETVPIPPSKEEIFKLDTGSTATGIEDFLAAQAKVTNSYPTDVQFFTGKNVVITGGTSGIGFEIAVRAVLDGASNVLVCGRPGSKWLDWSIHAASQDTVLSAEKAITTDEAEAKEAWGGTVPAAAISPEGFFFLPQPTVPLYNGRTQVPADMLAKIEYVPCELADRQSVAAFVQEITSKLPQIDYLFLNGQTEPNLFDTSLDSWYTSLLQPNGDYVVQQYNNGVQYLLALLKPSSSTKLFLTTSVAGIANRQHSFQFSFAGIWYGQSYGAVKASMLDLCFTGSVAGLDITCIAPGVVNTRINFPWIGQLNALLPPDFGNQSLPLPPLDDIQEVDGKFIFRKTAKDLQFLADLFLGYHIIGTGVFVERTIQNLKAVPNDPAVAGSNIRIPASLYDDLLLGGINFEKSRWQTVYERSYLLAVQEPEECPPAPICEECPPSNDDDDDDDDDESQGNNGQ